MLTAMENCGPALTPDDIEALEVRIGVALPREYQDFLLRFNGGRPKETVFQIASGPGGDWDGIHTFFGVGSSIESRNLDWMFDVISDRTPPRLVPIAYTDGGDLVCLDVGECPARVVFLDEHVDSDPALAGSWESRTYLVSSTFDEFLESLREDHA